MRLFCYQFRTYDDEEFQQVHMWCLNEDSEPVLVRFNYYIDIYMILPTFIGTRRINWFQLNRSGITFAVKLLNLIISDSEIDFKYECLLGKTLYYYKGESNDNPDKGLRYPTVKLRFRTKGGANDFVTKYKEGITVEGTKINLIFCENEEDPILKFTCEFNINHVGWVELDVDKVAIEDRISRCLEYIGDRRTLRKYEGSDLNSMSIHPAIVSFDIESFSHNPRAFPDCHDIRDPCFMICFVWKRLGCEDTLKIGLVYGLCPKSSNCDELILTSDEEDFYSKFIDIMRILDPDIITGYNICGYDNPVIHRRIVTYTNIAIANISRLKNLPGKKFYVDRSWSSSASTTSVKKFETPGVICFDLYHYVSRELNEPSNKLGFISLKYCGEGKDPITPAFMFETFGRLIELLKNTKGNNRGSKITIKESLENFNESLLSPEERDEYEEVMKNMEDILHYCIVDCIRPLDLIDVFDMWVTLCEMSAICGVQIEDVYSMGTGRRSTALITREVRKENYIIDRYYVPHRRVAGGKVFEAMPGFYDFVMLFDFKSLYPTIIAAHNLCYTTIVKEGLDIDDSRVNIYNEDGYQSKFVKKEEKIGVLPKILVNLLESRQNAKKEMFQAEDENERKIKDKRQLALKICANALYGYTISRFSQLPCIPVGGFTTQLGRANILRTSEAMTQKYGGKIVFGDTDSFGLCPDTSNPNEILKMSGYMLDDMNGTDKKKGMYDKPMEMELEQIAAYLITGKKKKYAYCERDMDVKSPNFGKPKRRKDGSYDIQIKGLPPVRRETTPWLKSIYCELLQMIFDRTEFDMCLDYVLKKVGELMNGDVDIKYLVKKNRMNGDYTSLTCPMKVFSDRMETRGKPIQRGEMVEFLITNNGGTKNGEKMELYENVVSEGLVIDNQYYILDCKKLFALLGCVFDNKSEITWKYKTGKYRIERISDYICRRMRDNDIPNMSTLRGEIFQYIRLGREAAKRNNDTLEACETIYKLLQEKDPPESDRIRNIEIAIYSCIGPGENRKEISNKVSKIIRDIDKRRKNGSDNNVDDLVKRISAINEDKEIEIELV